MSDMEPKGPMNYASTAQPGNGLAVASLVLGLVSIVFMCIWYIAVPCGILAIVFGAVGRAKANQGASGGGMAVAGLICGLVGLFLPILLVLGCLAALGIGGASLTDAIENGSVDEFFEALEDAATEGVDRPSEGIDTLPETDIAPEPDAVPEPETPPETDTDMDTEPEPDTGQ